MKGIKYLLLVVFLAYSVTGCKKPARSLFYSYNQQAMLTNIGTNILVPGINNFATSATATQTAIDSFIANPGTATLNAAQSAFAQMAINWATIEPFNFGPMTDNLWAQTIDTWPIDTGKVQTAISSQANATTQGADSKGLKTLEYLLYDANGNQAVLAKYANGNALAANQKSYLSSVMASVASTATALQSSWTGSGNYLNSSFILAQGNNVGSSVSLLVNSIAFYMDQVKNMKIGSPIGMSVKVNDNQPHPNLIEYPLSGLSLPAINANLVSMKAVLDGGSTGPGLKDLLNFINAQQNGQSLSIVGDNDFVTSINEINAITPPFAMALTNQSQQLQTAFLSLRVLIVYFEVDAAGDCGISITFNDNDGD
jgi:predicted lipoprotein